MQADSGHRVRTVLFVAYFFPPLGGGGVQRTVKFVKHLPACGWHSEVVTVRARDYWVSDATLAADLPPDTRVHRTASLTGLTVLGWWARRRPRRVSAGDQTSTAAGAGRRSSRLFAALRWLSSLVLVPDAYLGWLPFAWWTVRRRLRRGGVDVVITTSSPDTAHLVGLLLGRRRAARWVADFRDPWVRRLTFQAPTKLHLWMHTMLERRVLERADRVLVTNRQTRDDFLARHPSIPGHRFAIIPNGFDADDLAAAATVAPPLAGEGGKLKLLHSGLLSGRRTLAPVLDALARLAAEQPGLEQRLVLFQLGPYERINERLVRQRRLERCVRFLPAVDHLRVMAAMRAADALVLIEHGSERGALITPGKIFEYLASRRPILAVVPEGPAAELVRDLSAGVVVAPEKSAAIAGILGAWLEAGPPASGVDEARLAPYTRRALSEKLAAVLDALCA